MPVSVPVRNLSKTNVIYSTGTKADAIEWGYHGSPDASDFQEVPEEVWNTTRMRAARNRGILGEASIEEMEAAFVKQREAADAKAAGRAEEVAKAIAGQQQAIVISADAMEQHLDATAKQRPSSVLKEVVEQAAVPGTPVHDVVSTL